MSYDRFGQISIIVIIIIMYHCPLCVLVQSSTFDKRVEPRSTTVQVAPELVVPTSVECSLYTDWTISPTRRWLDSVGLIRLPGERLDEKSVFCCFRRPADLFTGNCLQSRPLSQPLVSGPSRTTSAVPSDATHHSPVRCSKSSHRNDECNWILQGFFFHRQFFRVCSLFLQEIAFTCATQYML